MNRLNIVKNFKAYTLRFKDRRQQNIALLRAYFKKQRSIIIQNTRKKMFRGVMWMGILSVSYYIIHRIYSQKLQVQRMQKKLLRLYPTAVTKINSQKNQVYYVVPQYDDQLANIIQLCWKFHYKIIVNSDSIQASKLNEHVNKLLIDIPEIVREKCVFINLKNLKAQQIDEINRNLKVQSGITCKQLNEKLHQLGYEPIFPQQITGSLTETVYNAIVNNYPTINGPICNVISNLEIISPQGHYFRSSNQNNQYGSTPNLNSIFIGTGGVFGLPLRANFKVINKVHQKEVSSSDFEIQSNDLNQKLLITRKVRDSLANHQDLVKYEISNSKNNEIHIQINSKGLHKNSFQSIIQNFKKQVIDIKQTKVLSKQKQNQKTKYNIFFNTNQIGFEKFLLFRQSKTLNKINQTLNYSFKNSLLKVNCKDQPLLIQLIAELCSQNSVVIWSQDHKFLKQIKKMTDQHEVGSQLMKILVQIRQGIDHKKIYYAHNRYQEYFAKGTFRKLTEVFW